MNLLDELQRGTKRGTREFGQPQCSGKSGAQGGQEKKRIIGRSRKREGIIKVEVSKVQKSLYLWGAKEGEVAQRRGSKGGPQLVTRAGVETRAHLTKS